LQRKSESHLDAAETAIDATHKNLRQGQPESAQVTAMVAIAESVLAVRDQLYLLSLPPDQRP
jgi:hypothetical protein